MSSYKIVTINGRAANVSDSGIFADIRFDPSDATPDYIGLHVDSDADTNSNDWKIYKFTYGASGATRIQLAYGTWDDRASYF